MLMVKERMTGAFEAEKLMKLALKDVVGPDGEITADMATVRLKPLRLLTTI
jgi:hypothetical protein